MASSHIPSQPGDVASQAETGATPPDNGRYHAQGIQGRIPPHQKLRGVQLAGWQPKTLSSPSYKILHEHDIAIPLPDGTILRGDLYRPAAEGSFPALIAWSPYTKELQHTGVPLPINEVGVVSYIVSRGYCHLTVNARGMGKSEGTRSMQFSPIEQRDVADVIEWTAMQNWCDCNVGMIGMSYFATIQYLAAAQQPPHLKAIFPYLGFTDLYRHFVYHGGAFHADFFASYYSLVGSTQKLSLPPLLHHLLGYILNRHWAQTLGRRLFFQFRTRIPQRSHPEESWMHDFATLAFDELYDGPFYQERSAWPVLDRITIPICIGTNWGNPGLHMRGAFQAWHAVRAPKKLFIGPPDPTWPWQAYQQELLAWYDFHLKGLDTGINEQPAVRYWLMGEDRWRHASGWPIPGAAKQRLYLTPQTSTNAESHALHGQRPEQESMLSFIVIPRGMLYPKALEHYENQTLRYVTEPWDEQAEVVGPITLQVKLASTAIDTHIIARVSDLAPDGTVRKLSFGWLQASQRKVVKKLSRPDEIIHEHRTPQPLVPGKPVTMIFSLTPTANMFKAGHRLLLEIGSRPDLLNASASEGFICFPYEAPPYAARNTVFHGGDDASYLEFEVRQD